MKGSVLPSAVGADKHPLALTKDRLKHVLGVGLKVVLTILLLGVFSYSHQTGSAWTNRALKACGLRGDGLSMNQNTAAPCGSFQKPCRTG